jgi:hypothetical protein
MKQFSSSWDVTRDTGGEADTVQTLLRSNWILFEGMTFKPDLGSCMCLSVRSLYTLDEQACNILYEPC